MSNRQSNIIAFLLLVFMFLIALFSMRGDSLTMDELAHLPAGYSYLTKKDMRLNPEHPPLVKDLSASLLLFLKDIKFPSEAKEWQKDINGQWGFGNKFLFKIGNPADKIIFLGRLPMLLILILLGFYIFRWTREVWGNKAGLLALFFFSFSPTFIAHGRLVTTDVGAATAFFISTYYFVKFLKDSSKKNLVLAGIVFGLAQLTKFSAILLFPIFAILLLFFAISKANSKKEFLKILGKYLLYSIIIILIAYFLIWLVYLFHTWNYPAEKQAGDTKFILSSFGSRKLANLTTWMADKPLLRPIAQYLLGVLMVIQRAVGGNTTYFLGEVSAAGWKIYFPTVYLIKQPLAFILLLLIAILYSAWRIKKPFWQNTKERFLAWLKSHFEEFTMLTAIAVYWAFSLKSNLNIGVRHLLPVFPFTFVLVAKTTVQWIKPPLLNLKRTFLAILLLWEAVSVLAVYPHFIAYFNELVGGPSKGYIYVVDSNLDWGQDLKRLAKWVEKNNIDKIYVDYFGGADTRYYLKDKYRPWQGTNNPEKLPKNSWLAVSATPLQGGRGIPAPHFDQPSGFYLWLNKYNPVTVIGHSIFVYHISPAEEKNRTEIRKW